MSDKNQHNRMTHNGEDFVKVHFRARQSGYVPESESDIHAEAMWVRVVEEDEDGGKGILDNNPVYIDIKCGDGVRWEWAEGRRIACGGYCDD